MKSRVVTFVLATILATATLPADGFSDGSIEVPYTGELTDDQQSPISGVFIVDFKAMANESATEPIWTERHFLAIDEGQYHVRLGSVQPIPASLANQSRILVVELLEFGEVARQPFTFVPAPPVPSREEVIAGLNLTYADVAERALLATEADAADDCLKLGGKSLDELDRYSELLQEITAVKDTLDGAAGIRLGTRTTTLERVGGAGGNPYSKTCPAGHVVTGMRGGSGDLIDSIELICSPLQ